MLIKHLSLIVLLSMAFLGLVLAKGHEQHFPHDPQHEPK